MGEAKTGSTQRWQGEVRYRRGGAKPDDARARRGAAFMAQEELSEDSQSTAQELPRVAQAMTGKAVTGFGLVTRGKCFVQRREGNAVRCRAGGLHGAAGVKQRASGPGQGRVRSCHGRAEHGSARQWQCEAPN